MFSLSLSLSLLGYYTRSCMFCLSIQGLCVCSGSNHGCTLFYIVSHPTKDGVQVRLNKSIHADLFTKGKTSSSRKLAHAYYWLCEVVLWIFGSSAWFKVFFFFPLCIISLLLFFIAVFYATHNHHVVELEEFYICVLFAAPFFFFFSPHITQSPVFCVSGSSCVSSRSVQWEICALHNTVVSIGDSARTPCSL